jgi:hypothetical protein
MHISTNDLETLFPNAKLNLLSQGSGCLLQAGTGHGWPGRALGRISIGTWGLCAHLCLVLVCGGRYCLGGGSSLHPGIKFGRSRTCEGSSGGRKRGVV